MILGVAYKKNVSDTRESPALDIIHLLKEKGAHVTYHDPFVPSLRYDELSLDIVPDLDVALREADCVVIVTDHTSYDWSYIASQTSLLIDTRGILR